MIPLLFILAVVLTAVAFTAGWCLGCWCKEEELRGEMSRADELHRLWSRDYDADGYLRGPRLWWLVLASDKRGPNWMAGQDSERN